MVVNNPLLSICLLIAGPFNNRVAELRLVINLIGMGAGADSRRSLGLVVVGGLLVSQLLMLYITPVVYIALDSLQRKWRGKKLEPAKTGETTSVR